MKKFFVILLLFGCVSYIRPNSYLMERYLELYSVLTLKQPYPSDSLSECISTSINKYVENNWANCYFKREDTILLVKYENHKILGLQLVSIQDGITLIFGQVFIDKNGNLSGTHEYFK